MSKGLKKKSKEVEISEIEPQLPTPSKRGRKPRKSAISVKSETDIELLNRVLPNAWNMTSQDYNKDPEARLSDIYSQMRDHVSVKTFQAAILENRHLFTESKVLVIGCTMFTLPLWAVKAGAKLVYVVDKSHAMEYLQMLVTNNKINQNIKLINSRIEEVNLPTKVDIIISNWMGYSLLSDSKCYEVIYARDKWLKKNGGIIMPDKAQLCLAGMRSPKKKMERVDWWRNVQGFNLEAMRKVVLKTGLHQKVDRREIITKYYDIWEIDLGKATYEDLKVHWMNSMCVSSNGQMDALVTFFRVNFSHSHRQLGFSTSPYKDITDWKQTVFYFDTPIKVNTENPFLCTFSMRLVNGFKHSEKITVNMKMQFSGNSKRHFEIQWDLAQRPSHNEPDVEGEEKMA